jgi:hypothetical protein
MIQSSCPLNVFNKVGFMIRGLKKKCKRFFPVLFSQQKYAKYHVANIGKDFPENQRNLTNS